jgi:hypothetical protein
MPKRVKQGRRPTDINQIAHSLVEKTTYEPEVAPEPIPQVPASISQYMAAIGKKGGKIGGKRRLDTVSAKKRKKIASDAAKARWEKKRQQSD